MLNKKTELLAPSGDMECIQTAIRYGADAIYCGGPFMQLRAESAGFTKEKLTEASEFIHKNGKRLYVTVNCFANNSEIPLLGDYARWLKDIGVDAVIVSDVGAIAEIKANAPDLQIHLSTQTNCMNYKAAEVYYNMGVRRIVLARELSIEQITELRAKCPKELELEGFVHGAMCMSYSGRCLLSAYLAGRSGNRGACAQSCRWNYYLMEEKRPGEYYKIEENDQGTTILSSKELCCLDIIDKLEASGINSFKIEGRMRTPFYVAAVVNAYRMAIDGTESTKNLLKEVDTASHRPFCHGFYLGDPNDVATDSTGYIRDWLFLGKALENSKDGKVQIETRNPFAVGDEIQYLTPGKIGQSFKLTSITDEEGNAIDRSSSPMKIMTINAPDGVKKDDIFRLKK